MPKTGNRPQSEIIVGQRIGRGVVTRLDLRLGTRQLRGAELACDCGQIYQRPLGHLRSGKVQSCGCLRRECGQQNPVMLHSTHGMAGHPLYSAWYKMIDRCENPRAPQYRNYGARGITVWPDWHDPRVFIAWVERNLGPRPLRMSLDRINNDRGYEPGNVRWASDQQQYENTSRRGRDAGSGRWVSAGLQ